MKCSSRKSPMGTMPLSECSRRNRNDVPAPARSGATPALIFPGTDCVDDAKREYPLLELECRSQPFIMLVDGVESQETFHTKFKKESGFKPERKKSSRKIAADDKSRSEEH